MNSFTRFSRGTVPSRVGRQMRFSSTEAGVKPVSPHVSFYKQNGRPIFKVLLMATFTYQFVYWGWVYLEKNEIKREKTADIGALEGRLAELTGKDVVEKEGKP